MNARMTVMLVSILFALVACDGIDAESPSESENAPENEKEEYIEEDNSRKEKEGNHASIEESADDELSTDVRFSGKMELTKDGIHVEAESNLPAGVEVEIRIFRRPYGGPGIEGRNTHGKLMVEEEGIIEGTVPYLTKTFIDENLNTPIKVELRFNPATISVLQENGKELRAFYGENGENLEGPFVVESHEHGDEPSFYIVASDIVPTQAGEGFKIEEPVVGELPSDYGDTNVWIEAEIVDIDHHYIYVEGRSNLLYGTRLLGHVNESKFNYRTDVRKDGTFTMLLGYDSITDLESITIFSEADLPHPRGKVVRETHGEEYEHIEGDIVKPRFEDGAEQKIELIIPIEPDREEPHEDVDTTVDGDEMKLILSDEILFDFGKSDITPEGDQVIQEIANWLKTEDYKGLIKVYGHTDNVDGDEINQPLSESRAENVYEALESHLEDTSPYGFEVKGFGKYEPIAPNDTDEGRERNRRVEILLEN